MIKDSFVEVSKSESFKKLPFEMLYEFVRSEDIRVVREEQVYQAVLIWINSPFHTASHNKLNQMPDLFQEVRFPLIAGDFLRDILERDEVVKGDAACCDMVREAEKYVSQTRNPFTEPTYAARLLQPRKFMGQVNGIVCPGGWENDKATRKVYAYVASHTTWYPLTPLPCPRYAHTVLPFQRSVYVIGGRDETSRLVDTVFRFDTIANTWSSVRALPYHACAMAACVFQGEMLLVGGVGVNGSLQSVLAYSNQGNTWRRVANMAHARGGVAVACDGDVVYAVGGVRKTAKGVGVGWEQGIGTKWEYLDTVEVFEGGTKRWREVGPAPNKRAYASAVCINKKVYVIGGQLQLTTAHACKTVDVLDTTTGDWSSSVTGNLVPRSLCGIAVSEFDLFVVGGVSKEGESMRNVDTYNVNTCKWRKTNSLPVPLGGTQCCMIKLRLALLKEQK